MKYEKTLSALQRQVVDDQTAKLFNIVKEFPTVKTTMDKYTEQSNVVKKKAKEGAIELHKIKDDYTLILKERDYM